MRVALEAPYLSPENGGIRNFVQWLAVHKPSDVDLGLIAPQTLIEEARTLASATFEPIAMEDVSENTRQTFAYRMLESEHRGRLLGRDIPYFRRGTERLRRRFFADRLVSLGVARAARRFGADVVHIPMQNFVVKEAGGLPYLINPHDYQHEHLPQFFSDEVMRLRREVWYPVQRAASAVVVHSLQTREDAIRYAGIDESRIFYAPYGAIRGFPDPGEERSREIGRALGLPERYIFYPARMWGHKNHTGLLAALAHLAGKGVEIDCVFTKGGDCEAEVLAEAERLGIADRMMITGRLDQDEMGAAFRLAQMVVVPSLFEQNSGPMLEALHFGKAVAVSNIREMRTTLGDAGLLFDPNSVEEIANAIDTVISSESKRRDLEARAAIRCAELSWKPFVDTYRAAYRFAAGGLS